MTTHVVLQTTLVDGSVVSTVKLPGAIPFEYSPLESFVRDEPYEPGKHGEYWYETCIFIGGFDGEECRVLKRHKTEANAIVWHEDYLDKVIPK